MQYKPFSNASIHPQKLMHRKLLSKSMPQSHFQDAVTLDETPKLCNKPDPQMVTQSRDLA
jgi:hypothetical protein